MKPRNVIRAAAIAAAAALGAAACAHQTVRKPAPAAETAPRSDGGVSALAQGEPSVRDAAMISVPELKDIPFSYDSDRLSPGAEKTLRANASWLKDHPGVKVQVAGYCDERGTVEYNLALGQRRAASVRRYYQLLGVPGSRVATISYGKERQVCAQETEACWSRNRRAETMAAVAQSVSSARAVR